MKKLLGIGAIFAGAILLTGCGGSSNTYTCTSSYSEGGVSMEEKIVSRFDKDGKVESFDLVYTVSNEETANALYQAYSIYGANVKKSGKTVTISKAESIEGSQVQIVGMTKEEVKSFVLSVSPDATCK